LVDPRIERTLLFRLATSDAWERLVRRVPGGEAQAWRAARRYVAGTTQNSALSLAVELAD